MAGIQNAFRQVKTFFNAPRTDNVATVQEAKGKEEAPLDVMIVQATSELMAKIDKTGAKKVREDSDGQFLSPAHKSKVADMYGNSAILDRKNSLVMPHMIEKQGHCYHASEMQSLKYKGVDHFVDYWNSGEKKSNQGHITTLIHANDQSIDVIVELDSDAASLTDVTDKKTYNKTYKKTSDGSTVKEELSLSKPKSQKTSECNLGEVRYNCSKFSLDVKAKGKLLHSHTVSTQVITMDRCKDFTRREIEAKCDVARSLAEAIKKQQDKSGNIPKVLLCGSPLDAALMHQLISFYMNPADYTTLNDIDLLEKIVDEFATNLCATGVDKKMQVESIWGNVLSF